MEPEVKAGVRSVLVASSPLEWTTELLEIAAGGRPLVAADGGANHLARVGLLPQAVVGDLDSIRPGVRRWVGEDRVVARVDQNRTDLDKTLEYLFSELGARRVTVLAAIGGRVDHTIGNLGLLARLRLGANLLYRTADEVLLGLEGTAELTAVPGETWSFWTYDPAVLVDLEGVQWRVSGRALDAGGHPSISNVAVSDLVRVTARGGAVVVQRRLR